MVDNAKSNLTSLYDKKADSYGADYKLPAGNYFMWRKIKTAISLGNFKYGDHILEVGSANGPYAFELAKLGFKVTGVDLSPECINYANNKAKKENLDNVQFLVGDAENLSLFPDGTFDGAVSFSTLRYVSDPQRAMNEIFRVIKKHKAAVCDFPNRVSPWFNYLKPWLCGTRHIHDHSYFTSDIKHFFDAAGFQEIKVRRILYVPKFIKPSLLKIMRILDYIGELPILDNFASIIMCKGRKP